MTPLTVIILTKDESLHIVRAIASVQAIATKIIVVDSGSTDNTVELAREAGAEVLCHAWTNYATQFNWALQQLSNAPGWVLRLDADEVVTAELAAQISAGLPDVDGVYVGRAMHFLGQPVRWGGVFPIRVLRLFRNGKGHCENRWMDEHIVVSGPTESLPGLIIDDNRKNLDWWIAKHNAYASREVVDILNRKHRFMPQDTIGTLRGGKQAAVKRWIKDRIYGRLPGGLRAGLYFFYRYILRLGFLDGRQARAFHVLQGFWYRYLVDAKLVEVRRHMTITGDDPKAAIQAALGIDLGAGTS
ncbi:glycosyltransferase family 2 protein [Loktanella sp. D2R18]|uniref:glycosyltransferase family 2 protein n=1 Tax=Rhodobacterales TaxID=204455 RepID=UPI000DEB2221|nr:MULTISPECIES: glycosyltransferase family 2 protein [Rhodobacterales]MDO6588963.1 glycosyltransferase family 2 protein [Yoonia sp. 1_MG-2023]RBW41820.1 glycosyltransferase family 2 protein [Loktanella sp. D2R18]